MRTVRRTTAQALVGYLAQQWVERDGARSPFFGPWFGILGHGNLAGVGQALQEAPGVRFIPCRNEQAMVHMAVGYARMRNRLGAGVATSSIGPGATNMVTGAAVATVNRLPVLLLPGDLFARRHVAPVLQQLESESSQDVSVNDCFRPVSRYWDRINRPEQLVWALPEAMRVLTSPAQTGAVTLCLPQDVQAEAFDFPAGLFAERVWRVPRPRPDAAAVAEAARLIRSSRCPLLVAGGGVIYSEASAVLADLSRDTGIPVAETQAGKGAVRWDHPGCLGALGATGTRAANLVAREADLILGVGTRYTDFTTASRTAFQHPGVRFVNVNVAEFDAHKQDALALVGDARAALEELAAALGGYAVPPGHRERVERLRRDWAEERDALCRCGGEARLSQAQVIGLLNEFAGPADVVINAAGSAPGDLHKLWRPVDPKAYQVEYGYSCMGFEIPAALGVKLAAPERRVFALVGDGSYLMLPQELVTAVQEQLAVVVVLVDNHGYASIGALSRALGSGGFGAAARVRGPGGALDGPPLPLDFVANARSLGAFALRAEGADGLRRALAEAAAHPGPSVVVVETDPDRRVGGYESWWDVPVAETSTMERVRQARAEYDALRRRQRCPHGEQR